MRYGLCWTNCCRRRLEQRGGLQLPVTLEGDAHVETPRTGREGVPGGSGALLCLLNTYTFPP